MSSALEPDIAPETAVSRKRPPKTLLKHPPKRTTFHMLLSRRKLTKGVQSAFCGICGGIPGFAQNPHGTKKSAAEPRYMTFEAQNFLLNKDTWLLTLTLEDVVIGTAAGFQVKFFIPKLYFEAKTPVFTPFFYRSPCFSVVKVC